MRTAAVAFTLAATLLSAPAFAYERDATRAERDRVVQHLTKEGYTRIADVDVVNGRFEVDARSRSGADVDLILNMKTLNVIRENPS
ncbi:MAG: PepSY domain-containing protein [Aestuariivirga sp.]|nr:PepSY domain-containing protein [Aestuariivirga sp.]